MRKVARRVVRKERRVPEGEDREIESIRAEIQRVSIIREVVMASEKKKLGKVIFRFIFDRY